MKFIPLYAYLINSPKRLVAFVKWIYNRHMKHVTLVAFSASMVYSAYIVEKVLARLSDSKPITAWSWFLVSLIALISLLSITYACILGRREDRERIEKHNKEMELLQNRIDININHRVS